MRAPLLKALPLLDRRRALRRLRGLVWAVACIAVGLAVSPAAVAQTTITWSGTTSNDWFTTSNWTGGVAPGATSGTSSTDYALFNTNPTNKAPTWATYLNLAGFTFDAGAGAYTIGTTSGSTAFLTSGGTTSILTGVTAAQIINAPLVITNASGSSFGGYTFLNSSTNSAATLTLGGNISGQATTGNATSLTFSPSAGRTITVSGTISDGSGGGRVGLVKNGAGTLTLSTRNTFSGNIAVNSGTLDLSAGQTGGFTAVGANTAGKTLTVASGATLVTSRSEAIDFASNVVNNIAVTISGTWNNTSGLQRVDSLTLNSGVINDSGNLAGGWGGVNVAGTVTVSGTSTWNQLGSSTGLTLGNPTTINVQAVGDLFVVNGGFRNNNVFTAAGLTKTGSGTLQITGSSSNTGNTAINGGVIALGNVNALGTTGTISFGGGTLQFSGSNTVDYSSRFSTANNQAYRLDTNSQNVTLGSALSSSGGSLTKLGSGTLTLSGSNTYTGTTTLAGGVLAGGTTNAFGSSAALAVNSGTVNLAGFNQTIGALSGSSGSLITTNSAAGTATLTASVSSGSATFAGTIADNGAGLVAFTKSGAGTQILTAANTYSGTTTINAGVLQIGAGGTTGGLSASSAITGSAGGTLAFSRTDDYGGNFANSIGGAVNVTLNSGTLTLSSANTYSGATTVAGGVLQAGIANAFGSSAPLAVNSGTVNLAGFNQTIGALSGLAGSLITTNSAAGTTTLTTSVASGTSTFAGVIADNGSGRIALTKNGDGTLTLSARSTYSGNVAVNAGTLTVAIGGQAGGSALGSNTVGRTLTVASGATLVSTITDAVDFLSNVVNNIAFNISGTWNNNPANTASTGFQRVDTLTLNSGVINDYGNHLATGTNFGGILMAGSVAVSGTSTYNQLGLGLGLGTGTATVFNVPNSTDLFVVNGGLRTVNATAAVGAGTLTKTGLGTMIVNGSSTYTGATAVNGGTLQIGNSGTTGLLPSSSAISIASGATLAFRRTDNYGGSFANAISGSGGITLLSGSLTLSGSNGYTGATSIAAGILSIAAPNALAGTSGVTIAGGAGLTYTGSAATFSKPVTVTAGSGTGTITNSGGGLLTLSGNLSKDNSVLRLTGGSFNVTGVISGATPGASDLFVDAASVTLSNTNTYDGPTYVFNSGTLALGVNNAIPNTSAVTLGDATSRGTLVLGSFTDSISQLIFSGSGGTLSLSGDKTAAAQLATAGSLTLGSNANLVLTGAGTTDGLYRLISATSISGSFSNANVTGVPSNYKLLYTATGIDLQRNADQSTTFTMTTGTVTRALVNTTVALSGSIANSSPAGSANLAVSLSSGGVLSVTGLTSGTSSLAPQTSTSVAGTLNAGATVGSRSWSVINTDNGAIQTTSTASGSIDVVNQRSFSVSNSGTINLGNFLWTAAVTGSATISSTGLNATTANATLGAFSGTSTNGFSLGTVDSTTFNGDSLNQSALYTLSGSAASAGAINGSFTSSVTAELGSIDPVSVALVGTAYDPATASFASGLTTTSLLVDIGTFNQNTGDHTRGFSIYNLFTDPTYTADLTLLSITNLDTPSSSLSIDLTAGSFGNLVAGGTSSWLATLTSGVVGSFSNQYQLNFVSSKAGQSLGGPQSMTLTVTGVIVVPEPGALALAGIGIAAAAWAFKRRK